MHKSKSVKIAEMYVVFDFFELENKFYKNLHFISKLRAFWNKKITF